MGFDFEIFLFCIFCPVSLALFLSFLFVALINLFISIKKKQPFSSVFDLSACFPCIGFFSFIFAVPIVIIFALNTNTVHSYSIVDNSICLCSTTTSFFGTEIVSESKICSYIQLDGFYYLIHDDNSLSLIEFDS